MSLATKNLSCNVRDRKQKRAPPKLLVANTEQTPLHAVLLLLGESKFIYQLEFVLVSGILGVEYMASRASKETRGLNGRAQRASRAQAVGVLVRYYCGWGRGGGPNLSPVLIGEAGTALECFLSSRECGRYGKHGGSPSRPALAPVPATSAALRLPGSADKRGALHTRTAAAVQIPLRRSENLSLHGPNCVGREEPHRRRDPRPLEFPKPISASVRSGRC